MSSCAIFTRKVLAAGDDVKLAGLLDRIDGIAPAVSKADDLGLGCLSL